MNDQLGDPILLPSKKIFFLGWGGGGGCYLGKRIDFRKRVVFSFLNFYFFSLLVHLQEQLIRKLAVILDVQDEDIIVEHLKEAGVGHRYVKYCLAKKIALFHSHKPEGSAIFVLLNGRLCQPSHFRSY